MADEDTNTNPRDLQPATPPPTHNPDSEDRCVICLEDLSDPCELAPCGHYNFDVGCIGTWFAVCRRCPLCRAFVDRIKRGPRGLPGRPVNVIRSPAEILAAELWPRLYSHTPARCVRFIHAHSAAAGAAYTPGLRPASDTTPRDIERRRNVYARGVLSIHVVAGPISGYRELTPALFRREPQLLARARAFLRRELLVFDCVSAERTAFLVDHVVTELHHRDIGATGGGLDTLLTADLGMSSARLLLHELRAWLRGPYPSLAEWDAAVRYPRLHESTVRVERQNLLREREERDREERERGRMWKDYKYDGCLPYVASTPRLGRFGGRTGYRGFSTGLV